MIFSKNRAVQFCNKYLVVSSQKTPFFALKKWKIIFLCKEKEKLHRQHCSTFQDAQLCTIWAHFKKLCHECGHNTRHLAWKPRIFVHGSSVLRTLFQDNCPIQSLLFFIDTRSLEMTHCEGFLFFWIFYADFEIRSNCRHDHS